jgi:hypothetical protein
VIDSTVVLRRAEDGRFRVPTRYWLVFGMFLLSVLLYVDRVCISSAKSDIASELKLATPHHSCEKFFKPAAPVVIESNIMNPMNCNRLAVVGSVRPSWVGSCFNLATRQGNVPMLALGGAAVTVAIVLDGLAYKRLARVAGKLPSRASLFLFYLMA